MAMVSAFSPLAELDCITAQDISGYPVVSLKDDVLSDALDDYIKETDIRTITNTSSIVYEQILEHQAISFAPKLIKATSSLTDNNIALKKIKGFFDTEFGIITGYESTQASMIAQVIGYITNKTKESISNSRWANTYEII